MMTIYFPIGIYGFWLAIKSRSIFYFSATNPSIPSGGMVGDSKYDILQLIDPSLTPRTIKFNIRTDAKTLINSVKESEIVYPLVAKPDVGDRGWKVELIKNEKQLIQYCSRAYFNFLVQEFIDLPIELGVFYYRFPNSDKGSVSSVVVKDTLKVIGDGFKTIRELMLKNDRAKLQIGRMESMINLDAVLSEDEVVELEPIGNHNRGTTFLNGNHLINDQLVTTFDAISKKVEGFYYGRYDLRCRSYEDLYAGNVKILELNGVCAEPAHIYQPGYPFFKAFGELLQHWKVMYRISKVNRKRGVPFMTHKKGFSLIREHLKMRKA